MEELFEPILEKNEKILDTLKPNLTKFMLSSFCWTFFGFGFVFVFGALCLFFNKLILAGIITTILLVVVCALVMLFCRIFYNTCYYAITDKKIIIRSGVFGVDFKTLDLDSIGAVNVDVSLLDKILGKTGTVTFGSKNSPLVSNGNAYGAGYKFAHIEQPYEFYKRAKERIEEAKVQK